MIAVAKPNLNDAESKELEQFLAKYGDIFAMQSEDYGQTNRVYHRIAAERALPIHQPPRGPPCNKIGECGHDARGHATVWVYQRVRQPLVIPMSSSERRTDLCFCVDCRKLNDVTRKDRFPLLQIDRILDMLARAKWFSTLDLKSGYWQVDLHLDDEEKISFSMYQRLWQFTVMPFGLCNAPETFERLMETTLRGLTSHVSCTWMTWS
jgi:hypothetical protein